MGPALKNFLIDFYEENGADWAILSAKGAKDKAYRCRPYLAFRRADSIYLGRPLYGPEKLSNAWHLTFKGLFFLDEIHTDGARDLYYMIFQGIFSGHYEILSSFLDISSVESWRDSEKSQLKQIKAIERML